MELQRLKCSLIECTFAWESCSNIVKQEWQIGKGDKTLICILFFIGRDVSAWG
jgi:hypothetical protein